MFGYLRQMTGSTWLNFGVRNMETSRLRASSSTQRHGHVSNQRGRSEIPLSNSGSSSNLLICLSAGTKTQTPCRAIRNGGHVKHG